MRGSRAQTASVRRDSWDQLSVTPIGRPAIGRKTQGVASSPRWTWALTLLRLAFMSFVAVITEFLGPNRRSWPYVL